MYAVRPAFGSRVRTDIRHEEVTLNPILEITSRFSYPLQVWILLLQFTFFIALNKIQRFVTNYPHKIGVY
jgi:hypothetical protein